MDLKLEAARAAVKCITDQTKLGLGEGSTIAFLVQEIQKSSQVSPRTYYTSSEKTRQLLADAGFNAGSLDETQQIDIYFDGCDQVDHALNALKSGAGIHSMEKLLAGMATEFVILADESKYVLQFDGKHPLVVEIIPEALAFLQHQLEKLAPGTALRQRKTGDGGAVLTSHGNILIDCWLTGRNDLINIGAKIKSLPGVLDSSLFVGFCQRAIIAGPNGTRIVYPAGADPL